MTSLIGAARKCFICKVKLTKTSSILVSCFLAVAEGGRAPIAMVAPLLLRDTRCSLQDCYGQLDFHEDLKVHYSQSMRENFFGMVKIHLNNIIEGLEKSV